MYFRTSYFVDKEDKGDEGDVCPPAKKIAVDSSLHRGPPLFYVTKVRGIGDHYNSSTLAIGLKGTGGFGLCTYAA